MEIFIFVVLFVVDMVCCFWECWFIELVDFCEKEGLDGCFIDKLIFDDFSKDFFNLLFCIEWKLSKLSMDGGYVMNDSGWWWFSDKFVSLDILVWVEK